MKCDCIARVNELLRPMNIRIDVGLVLLGGKWMAAVVVPTVLIEKKRGQKPKYLFGDFCPFCGEKYVPGRAEEDETCTST